MENKEMQRNKCPNCGATYVRGDVTCKKCGAVLVDVTKQYNPEEQYRSRGMLLVKCWIGGVNGSHLRWLGYNDKADEIKSKFGWKKLFGASFNFLDIINPVGWIQGFIQIFLSVGYLCIEMLSVALGKYRTDANGHPVRWLKSKNS